MLLLSGFAVAGVACGGGEKKNEGKAGAKKDGGDAAPKPTGKEEAFTVEVGDEIKFSKTEMKCSAGSTVKVTIKHTGKMEKTAMGHNFVLLAKGADVNAVAADAVKAAPTYIPPNDKRILAHTKLVGGGEEDTVEFTAPAKGTYKYICTFPGHVSMMQGKLVVS